MLQIEVPLNEEGWDPVNEVFILPETKVITLEHSLVSISKWEAKWHKPFLEKIDKTDEEILHYIKCMTLTQNVDPDIYNHLSAENMKEINDYITNPMTATWFLDIRGHKAGHGYNGQQVTSELIYSWMVALGIPVEFQKWHLNRLMTLIRVCNENMKEDQKMTPSEAAAHRAALNAKRQKQFNSKK